MNTSPTKAMECNNSVYSSVVTDASPSETVECADIVYNSCVLTKVKTLVPSVSEIFFFFFFFFFIGHNISNVTI